MWTHRARTDLRELSVSDKFDEAKARTLADAVEYTTGVRVENNCQNCNFSQIRLLGLEGPYTQLLIEGQPIVSSLAQVYGVEQIPARMIERIAEPTHESQPGAPVVIIYRMRKP